ncbi:hypothetical protein D3C85_784210 [compost metagenome]
MAQKRRFGRTLRDECHVRQGVGSLLTSSQSASLPVASDPAPLRGEHKPAPHPLGSTASRHCAAIAAVAARPATAVLASAANRHQACAPSTGAHRSAGALADSAPPLPLPANGRNHPAVEANGQTPDRQLAAASAATAVWPTFHRRKNTRRRVQSGCAGASELPREFILECCLQCSFCPRCSCKCVRQFSPQLLAFIQIFRAKSLSHRGSILCFIFCNLQFVS